MSTTHPINRTTEWDDLQIKHGNYAPLEPEVKAEAISQQAQDALEALDPLEHRSLEQLDRLEDSIDEDVLNVYRRKRLEELKEKKRRAKFGTVVEIGRGDYVEEVTNASMADGGKQVVVCLLYKDCIDECQLLSRIVHQLAISHPETKFCKGVSDQLVPNYQDKALPAILIYQGGVCHKQIVGTSLFGGTARMSKDSVEWTLSKLCDGFETELASNPLKADDLSSANRGTKGAVARLKGAIRDLHGRALSSSDSDALG